MSESGLENIIPLFSDGKNPDSESLEPLRFPEQCYGFEIAGCGARDEELTALLNSLFLELKKNINPVKLKMSSDKILLRTSWQEKPFKLRDTMREILTRIHSARPRYEIRFLEESARDKVGNLFSR